MEIQRNWTIPSPDEKSLLNYELAEGIEPFVCFAQKGSPTAISGVPKGVAIITDQGFVFVPNGEHGGIDKKRILGVMALGAVAQVSPLGLLAVAGSYLGTKALTRKNRVDQDAQFAKQCSHPDTIWIPFLEMTSVRYQEIGGFFSKSGYICIKRQTDKDHASEYFFTTKDDGFVEFFMVKRFGAEKEYLQEKAIEDIAGVEAFSEDRANEMIRLYGTEGATKHLEEFTREIEQHIDAKLKEKGISYESIDAQVKHDLAHFKGIPLLAEYFGG